MSMLVIAVSRFAVEMLGDSPQKKIEVLVEEEALRLCHIKLSMPREPRCTFQVIPTDEASLGSLGTMNSSAVFESHKQQNDVPENVGA